MKQPILKISFYLVLFALFLPNVPIGYSEENSYETMNNRGNISYKYYPACHAGWIYRPTQTTQFYNMVTGTKYINKTRKQMRVKSRITKQATLGTVTNGELSGGWGPVSVKTGLSKNASVVWEKDESCTMTVLPSEEGWIEYGTMRKKWSGPYLYLTDRCKEIDLHTVMIYTPGEKVVVAKTRKFK